MDIKYAIGNTSEYDREFWLDVQDQLYEEYPDELDSIYEWQKRVRGREPEPQEVVHAFAREYPDLLARASDLVRRG